MILRRRLKRKGLNLVELIIAISIFSFIGLLVGELIGTFSELYVRTRNQLDLVRMHRSLTKQLSYGDDKYFDGLKAAPEIIEATDKEIRFVPMYRQSSESAGYYTTHGLFNSQEAEGGPPPQVNGEYPGGLRVQYNEFSQKYELRFYLSKHPRAGSGEPEVYLRYDGSMSDSLKADLQTKLGITRSSDFEEYISKFQRIPTRMNWRPPLGFTGETPQSYVVITGGNFPIEIEGSTENPPSASSLAQDLLNNEGQLFPDPFNRPGDQLIIYYHPETDPAIIENQESLIANLFIKGAYPDAPSRFGFNAAATARWNKEGIQGFHDRSLGLYYDDTLTLMPADASLTNQNFLDQRLQFLVQSDLPGDVFATPTSFSYYSSRDTTTPIPLELEEGRRMVPPSRHLDISLVRLDLLATIGASIDRFKFGELSKRAFTHIVPLEGMKYTHHIHTSANGMGRRELGFQESNCLAGGAGELSKCRRISEAFPGGEQIRLSQTLYVSNIVNDPTNITSITGTISFIFRNPVNLKVYAVRVNFDQSKVYIHKKQSYQQEDLPFTGNDEDVMEFPLDNSQFINFTNLQSSGFLDEGFNYSNVEVYKDHLNNPKSLELYVEVTLNSNIEGFSLSYLPH